MKKKNVHKCALSYALEQILKWGLMILAESQSEDSNCDKLANQRLGLRTFPGP